VRRALAATWARILSMSGQLTRGLRTLQASTASRPRI
jgi:hypothetical protein